MSNKTKLVVSNNLANNQEVEDEIAEKQDVLNYKGVFYNEETENKYYEGGAHFTFKDLCRRLEKLFWVLSTDRRGESLYQTDKKEMEFEKLEKQSRNQKTQVIPHNTQNPMNLSLNRTRNPNNNLLFMNNMVYSKKMENGAEQQEKNSIIQISMDNKKSRNNTNTILNKTNDFIAKTNIYVKKSIENKTKTDFRDKKSNNLNIMRSHKPIYNNNNDSSISIKNVVAVQKILNNSSQVKANLISKMSSGSVRAKKVVYVEKTEINLQKSNNTSKSNITSQNETSLIKNINFITPSKQTAFKSSSMKPQEKSFNVQGIDMYKYISSLLQKKITTHQEQLTFSSKGGLNNNANFKKVTPAKNNFNSFFMSRGSNGRKNQHISYEVNLTSNQRKPSEHVMSNDAKKKSRNTADYIANHNTDKTPSVKSISYYIQNKRKIALQEEKTMIKNIKDSSQNSIIKSSSNKKDKIVENSFLKKSSNPLTSSNPPSQNSNNGKHSVVTNKFLNGTNNSNTNSNNFFRKIEVKPRNVLIKPDNQIKERYYEDNSKAAYIRDKKTTSIKVLSNITINNSNSKGGSNSFLKSLVSVNEQKKKKTRSEPFTLK